jgi:lipopolysaccharide export system permease protein
VLALTVSSANPRVGRSGNLLFALCAFVLYYNLLNLGQNWVGTGRYSMGGFMLALHGGALALALLWLAKRHLNWSWRPFPVRSR